MMPTVTAIALETLLEPGSSSSPTSQHRLHHHRCHSTSDPPSPSLKEHHNGRHNTSAAWPKEDHHHHVGRREQQPVFLSRRRRESSHVSGAPTDGRGSDAPAAGSRARSFTNGYYFSPKLYVTPEPTQIVPTGGVSSSSPNSVSSPSPYVVNHKRRDVPRPHPLPPAVAVAAVSNGDGASSSCSELQSRLDGFDSMTKSPDRGAGDMLLNGKPEGCLDRPGDEVIGRGEQGGEGINNVAKEEEEDILDSECIRRALNENERPDADINYDEDNDFFDPRELMSAVSCSDTDDTSSFRRGVSWRCRTPLTSQSEYYDAPDDFLSDSSFSRSSPSRANIEADLCSIRLNLFEEIDRRKKAEESLDHMQNMFQGIARQFSRVGSHCQSQPGWNIHCDIDSTAQFCQEAVVLRFVSESLESDLARAEAEVVAAAIIDAKNHEIGRLRDRLQYYEAMNQEMSQRNQQASELARRQRLKRKVRRRWIWGCIGLSITMGASLLAYSYLVHGGESPSHPRSEQHETPSGTIAPQGRPM